MKDDLIVQARVAVETYYPIDNKGNIDWEHPYEVNDCIEPEYVVREKTSDNCYGDLSDYSSYSEAVAHLDKLKGKLWDND